MSILLWLRRFLAAFHREETALSRWEVSPLGAWSARARAKHAWEWWKCMFDIAKNFLLHETTFLGLLSEPVQSRAVTLTVASGLSFEFVVRYSRPEETSSPTKWETEAFGD